MEGLLERMELALREAVGHALDRADRAAVGLDGEQQAGAHRVAVELNVQAPQTPCSQPTWVPVRPASWRMKSESSRRGSTSARVASRR